MPKDLHDRLYNLLIRYDDTIEEVEPGVFFVKLIGDNIRIHIQVHSSDETFFSIYENGESVMVGYGTLDDVIYDINKFEGEDMLQFRRQETVKLQIPDKYLGVVSESVRQNNFAEIPMNVYNTIETSSEEYYYLGGINIPEEWIEKLDNKMTKEEYDFNKDIEYLEELKEDSVEITAEAFRRLRDLDYLLNEQDKILKTMKGK